MPPSSCLNCIILSNFEQIIKISLNFPLRIGIFSTAVALLFNWKYFGVEISCGQHADDMWMMSG